LKRFIQSSISLYVVAAIIVILDQISKAVVRSTIPVGSYYSFWDWLTPIARFVHITNTGVAFGMFQGNNTFFIIMAAIVSIVIIVYYPKVSKEEWILRLALGMELAGALGNMIDRIIFGHVTDFVSVGTFAVFNIADASITVGVAVMLLGIWLQERKARQDSTPSDEQDNGGALAQQ
jgi:signal peptidase II